MIPKTISAVEDISSTPMCIELDKEMFPKVMVNAMGKVSLNGSMENVEHLLKEYGITCKFNMITRDNEIIIPGSKFTSDNSANASLNTVINLCINNQLPKGDVGGHITVIADRNAYNPVKQWISSKPWDGVDRISSVIDGVKVPDSYNEIKNIYLRKWLMCAVGMLDNGCDGLNLSYEGVLVFQGDQGLGKTSWFKRLAGKENLNLVKDGFELDLNSKDSKMSFTSHWMIELGELDATFKKSEVSALKAFITQDSDRFRRPYDRVDSKLPRRTVMFASVNDVEFLQDDTGNRRFWCLPVKGLELPKDFDPQQFWAQVAVELEKAGGARKAPWFITGKDFELRSRANAMFQGVDPIEEKIIRWLNPDDKTRCYLATSSMIADIIGEKATRVTVRNISKYMAKHFGDYKRTSTGRFYSIPLPDAHTAQQLAVIGIAKAV